MEIIGVTVLLDNDGQILIALILDGKPLKCSYQLFNSILVDFLLEL